MGLTFKINHPTGRYRSFSHATVDIKWNKEQVGYMMFHSKDGPNRVHGMRVTIHVKDANACCGWRNAILAKSFDDVGGESSQIKAFKVWLKEQWPVISNQFQIHPLTNQQPELL